MLRRAFRIIVPIFLLTGFTAAAQYDGPRIVWGLYLGAGAKAGLIQRPGMRYKALGEVNIGMSIGITGTDEHALTARLHLQNSRDNITIRIGPQEWYTIETLSFLVNPEVSLPIVNRYRESRLDLLAGIGADIIIQNWMSVHNGTSYYAGSLLSPLEDSVFSLRHKMTPYATLGLAFKFNRRASLVLRIRQDARNSFEKGGDLTLFGSTGERTVNLSAQATRFLLGFQFTLGKLPEIY